MFSFDDASLKSKEAMEAMMENYSSMSKSFQAIASEAADFTKSSLEDGVAHFEKLAGVKSIEDAVELQTAYVKSTFEKFMAQSGKMGEMYAGLAKDAYKPYEKALNAVKEETAQMADAA